MPNRGLARFAWGVLVFNLFVIVWGGFVRASRSGAGCGDHWPTCQGEVIPRSPTIETVIEFTHRITSGLFMIAVVALVVWTFRAMPKGHHARGAAIATLVFTLIEAAVGAGLVLLQYVADDTRLARGYWMCAHLVNTFLLLASNVLAARALSGGGPVRLRRQGALTFSTVSSVVAMLLLAMSGGIAALGDTLFPVDSLSAGFEQDLSPTAHLFLRMRVFHPVIAVGTAMLVMFYASTAYQLRKTSIVNRWSVTVAALVIGQILIGLLNLVLLAPIAMQMIHLLVADLLWCAFVMLAAESLPRETPAVAVPSRDPAALSLGNG